MTLKTYHHTIRPYHPILIVPTREDGRLEEDPELLSAIEMVDGEKKRQFNYSGPYNAITVDRLRNKRLDCLGKAFDEVYDDRKPIEMTLENNGYPIVLFSQDENGNPDLSRDFSVFSIGKRFNPGSGKEIKLNYLGPHVPVSFDDAMKMDYELFLRLERSQIQIHSQLKSRRAA